MALVKSMVVKISKARMEGAQLYFNYIDKNDVDPLQ